MKARFLGHSAVLLETEEHTLLFDPYLSGNPKAAVKAEDLSPDYIFVTHAHDDHVGDTQEIADRSGATVIATVEIAKRFHSQGLETAPMNIGGWASYPFGRARLTPAWHSSSFGDGSYGGMPAGMVVEVGEKRVYHAGDTAFFGDMRFIGELGLDLAFVPIGSNYTMDPIDAARAVELLNPRRVVPIHYSTFDLIDQDPAEFEQLVGDTGRSECVILEPGDEVEV